MGGRNVSSTRTNDAALPGDPMQAGRDARAVSIDRAGTSFVFGFLSGGEAPYAPARDGIATRPVFAFQILPFVIFISALSALLWHWRILPWIVRAMGRVFERVMRLGEATSLVVAAKVFLGMTEAPLLVRAYLPKLPRKDIFVVMTAGFATTAGTVLILYSAMLQHLVPGAAAHLITASLLSAPAAVLIARIIMPLAPGQKLGPVELESRRYGSSMDAITTGTTDGLKLYLNIIAMLVATLALVALANLIVGSVLPEVGGEPVSLERALGWVLAPLTWFIGVPWAETGAAGELLGLKTALNEFIAYVRLSEIPPGAISERTRLLMTYALCGFANFGAIGTMLATLTIVVPEHRDSILRFGFPAMFAGMLSTLLAAAVIGTLPNSMLGLS